MTSNSLVPGHLLVAIDHVGIAVPDLDDALEFYSRVFGLESIHEEVNEEQGVREAMLKEQAEARAAARVAPERGRTQPRGADRPDPAGRRALSHSRGYGVAGGQATACCTAAAGVRETHR